MQANEDVSICRFCPIESRFCERTLKSRGFPSAFLAYPSGKHWSQFFAELKAGLKQRGIQAESWEDTVTDSVIFVKICEAIHTHSFTLCELTTLNANVLFETGYSLAVGRDAIILRDRNRSKLPLPLLKVKEYCDYSTRQDIYTFLDRYLTKIDAQSTGLPLLQLNNIADVEERPGTLYYLRPRTFTQTIKSIHDQLERSPFKLTWSDPADASFDEFYHQARQIKESELVVGVLVSNNISDSQVVNAPVALLLGFAAGLGKKLLILQEQPNDPIVDLGTILREFEGERSAKSFVEYWTKIQSEALLRSEQRTQQMRKRSAETAKIRDVFLGQPDAMIDYNLMSYFLDTPQYRQAVNGVKQIFVGRKGAGKSAIFRALQEELRNRQSAILVGIAPTDFQFERLTGLAVDQYSALHPAFVFQTFWRYILFTEILRTISNRYMHFVQSSSEPHVSRILAYIQDEESILEEDFATRALRKLDALDRIPTDLTNLGTQAELESVLQKARMNQIEKDLQRLAKNYTIYVLIDDIDKYWNPSYEASVQLLLGLVNETQQIYSRFRGDARVAFFMRQDIFDVLRRYDEELVKRNIATLRWDELQLLQLIIERIRFSANAYSDDDDAEVWRSILPASVSGIDGWRFMVERTLMRPRDLLQFCQLAIETAQIHRHETVMDTDVLVAEKQYSEYMFEALRLEYRPVYPELDNVLFEFSQWQVSTSIEDTLGFIEKNVFSKPDYNGLEWIKACESDPMKLLEILYVIGFLGLEDRDRHLKFFSFEQTFAEAKRLCGKDPLVNLHPAFHKALYLDQAVH